MSTRLSVNRALYQSNRSPPAALADALLAPHGAGDVDSIPIGAGNIAARLG
jgi:hypothetical protein